MGRPFYRTYETADGRYLAVGCIEPKFPYLFLERLGVNQTELQVNTTVADGRVSFTNRRANQRRVVSALDRSLMVPTHACLRYSLSAKLKLHLITCHEAFVEVEGALQPQGVPRFSRTQTAHLKQPLGWVNMAWIYSGLVW